MSKRNILKTCLQVNYSTDICLQFAVFLYCVKKRKLWQKFANLFINFFIRKTTSKKRNDFPKDVENSTLSKEASLSKSIFRADIFSKRMWYAERQRVFIYNSFVHSLTHTIHVASHPFNSTSLLHSRSHSRSHPLTHLLTHSLTHTHSITHSPTHNQHPPSHTHSHLHSIPHLPIATDKALFFSSEKCWYLSYFSMKTYIVGSH